MIRVGHYSFSWDINTNVLYFFLNDTIFYIKYAAIMKVNKLTVIQNKHNAELQRADPGTKVTG